VAAGPVSRILSVPASRDGTAIPLGRALLCGSSDLPGGLTRRAGTCAQPRLRASSLFGLAPCGVCPARDITAAAVRSYRTFSPLPRCRGGMFSVALSVEPPARSQNCERMGYPPGRYPAHCSAEFGLSSPRAEARKATVRSGCLRIDYIYPGIRLALAELSKRSCRIVRK